MDSKIDFNVPFRNNGVFNNRLSVRTDDSNRCTESCACPTDYDHLNGEISCKTTQTNVSSNFTPMFSPPSKPLPYLMRMDKQLYDVLQRGVIETKEMEQKMIVQIQKP